MVGLLLLKEVRAGEGSQNGYNGFFWKQTFSLPTLEMKINQVEFGPPTLICMSVKIFEKPKDSGEPQCMLLWLFRMLIKFQCSVHVMRVSLLDDGKAWLMAFGLSF